MIISVRISRRTPEAEFEKLNRRLLAKVARGATLVGGWISPFEKAVKSAALEMGGKVIALLPEGMGRYYKPAGRDFGYCANGQLLQLSPFAAKTTSVQQQGSAGVRDHYGKARFEWLNLAAKAMADYAMGYAVPNA